MIIEREEQTRNSLRAQLFVQRMQGSRKAGGIYPVLDPEFDEMPGWQMETSNLYDRRNPGLRPGDARHMVPDGDQPEPTGRRRWFHKTRRRIL